MVDEILEIVLGGLIIAILADIVFGEPAGYVHVSVLSSRLSGGIAGKLSKTRRKRAAGVFTLYVTFIVIGIPAFLLLYYLLNLGIPIIIFLLIYSVMLKSTFSITSMGKKVHPIMECLKNEDLDRARFYLSMLSSRETSNLDVTGISSATIESIATGITDYYTGALFMYSIFGLVGATFYRIVNTLESKFGYKNKDFFYFGKPFARAYAVLNYIPSMITAGLIHASAFLLNLNVKEIPARSTFHNFQSRNAALSIGSMAAVLNVRLEKKGKYIVNANGFMPTYDQILNSLRIYYISSILMFFFITLPLLVFMVTIFWPNIWFINGYGWNFLF